MKYGKTMIIYLRKYYNDFDIVVIRVEYIDLEFHG